uniref:Peptidyl-tRNA hydrolase n=1 Tax=candidate division CPR3 bacterium TaxID=2268181 RepID=A0A7C4R1Z3_UNCC3
MKIIIGLGNPGKKYEITRHNVGFLALDRIIKIINNQSSTPNQHPILNIQLIQDFKLEKKLDAEIAKLKIDTEDIILVKPQTFMNLSGKSVKKIVGFYKIRPIEDLVVIHDDIDLDFGKVRIKNKGSSAGHNGVQSIIDELGTESFIRVRIGVGRPQNDKIAIEDWVLTKLEGDDLGTLNNILDELISKSLKYLNML